MKKSKFFCAGIACITLAGCNNNAPVKTDAHQFPKPGTVIVSVSEPVTGDPLNNFTFSIKVIADSDVTNGVYDVNMSYGPNTGNGKFTMPKGGAYFTPVIRKANSPYTYIIGFRIPEDTTFYDYFEVSSTDKGGNMRYIKAYTF